MNNLTRNSQARPDQTSACPGSHEPVADDADSRIAALAAAIGEPARARMLCSLLDGHARTATELGVIGGTGASTASGHLARLVEQGLVQMLAQGRHRYFKLAGPNVAQALEALMVVAGTPRASFSPGTPASLRHARTCYDHLAGEVAVELHDSFITRGWLVLAADGYAITREGEAGFADMGIDTVAVRASRRRMACPCMDWSQRRPHLAGALGAALLNTALLNGWLQQDLDSRAVRVTRKGEAAISGLLDQR